MLKKILIVEDEKKLCDVMKLYLSKEGYEVICALDGEAGEEYIDATSWDLIILDIMMPKKDGWSLLRKIKNNSSTPVILTTARGEEEDRIFGLELGADDYMVKPLSMRELVLRVNLRISALNSNLKVPLLTFDDLCINELQREVYESTSLIALTPKEFDLLIFFCKNPREVLSRDKLLNKVWGYEFMGDTRTIDTHVKNLREKIKYCSDHLKTVWGVGYKLEP